MICKHCKAEFTPRHGNQKYCSRRCRDAVHYLKYRDYRIAYDHRYRAANRELDCYQICRAAFKEVIYRDSAGVSIPAGRATN